MTLDPWLQQAVKAHHQGRLDDAESGYRAWLTSHPRDAFVLHQLGIIGLQRARPDQALPALATAADIDPTNATLLQHWGDALSGLRRHAEAEPVYRRGLAIDARHLHLRLHLGNALRAQGRFTEAEQAYRDVLALDSRLAAAHANLGHVLGDQRRFQEAALAFREASARGDTSTETILGAAQALLELGDTAQSETLCRARLQHFPADARLLGLLGESLRRQKAFDEAESVLRQAVSRAPAPLAAWHNLGKLLIDRSRPQEAEQVFRQLLAVAPQNAEVQLGLSLALIAQRRRSDAEAILRNLTAHHPGHVKGWVTLARAVLARAPAESLAYAQRALQLAPDDDDALAACAEAHSLNGNSDEALDVQRRVLRKPRPDPHQVGSLLAMGSYLGAFTDDETLALARQWNTLIPRPPLATPLALLPSPGRPLRVGYLSTDFRDHAVVSFFEPILKAHLAQSLDVFIYADVAVPDAVTQRLKSLLPADRWHFIQTLSDPAAASLIRRHEIAVLVDLGGHTRGNRLGVFAQRAAPVQACYLGYYGTTGLAEMDYWIGDEILLPPSLDAGYTEKLWRLPRCWLSYQPPLDCPEPVRLATAGNPPLTFGSFNNRQKVSRLTLDLWCRVLREVPDARMVVKTAGLDEESQQDKLARAFASHGIARERIQLRAPTPDRRSHLQHYNEIDIGLDTTPFTGGTTTAESLWMGVPVLTLLGQSMPGRMSASFLTAAGLEEWIARNEADFVTLARAHASHVQALPLETRSQNRRALRAAIAASPLADAPSLARHLAEAYRSMCHAPLRRARIERLLGTG